MIQSEVFSFHSVISEGVPSGFPIGTMLNAVEGRDGASIEVQIEEFLPGYLNTICGRGSPGLNIGRIHKLGSLVWYRYSISG